jgi:hypothetical protein
MDAKREVEQWGMRRGLSEEWANTRAWHVLLVGRGGVQHMLRLAEQARRDRESSGMGQQGEAEGAACSSAAAGAAQPNAAASARLAEHQVQVQR